MIHLNCREHLPCALATIDQLRRVNQQQADGWIETHNRLTEAKGLLERTTVKMIALDFEVTQLRDENAELRRRLGARIGTRFGEGRIDDAPTCGHGA